MIAVTTAPATGLKRMPATAMGLAALCALGASSAPAQERPGQERSGEAAPMVVTTDTPAYCLRLSERIGEDRSDLPAHVRDLRDEGNALCRQGRVRSGINRLRRALMALHAVHADDDGEASPE